MSICNLDWSMNRIGPVSDPIGVCLAGREVSRCGGGLVRFSHQKSFSYQQLFIGVLEPLNTHKDGFVKWIKYYPLQ